jgi:predicted nucleic acid-binding protein
MRFWDSSAIVPILLTEATTERARASWAEDRSMAVWWGTSVECVAAFARAERDGRLASDGLASASRALDLMSEDWAVIEPAPPVRLVAERLVRTHPLRAGDALQLAAAIAAAEGAPATMPFVTLDDRLATAAVREGFPVIQFDQA